MQEEVTFRAVNFMRKEIMTHVGRYGRAYHIRWHDEIQATGEEEEAGIIQGMRRR